MSSVSTINLSKSVIATKFGNEVELLDHEDDQIIYITKQDLLDMLKLFEEQEQENK